MSVEGQDDGRTIDHLRAALAREAVLVEAGEKVLMMVRAARIGAETTGQHGTVQLMNEIEAALAGVAPPRGC